MNESVNELGTQKISKLLIKYSVPAIIAMFVNAIYNVVDRIFIGQYVGEDALAALTIVFPLMSILFAFALLVGTGGANIISNKIGEKNIDVASKTFCNTILFGFILAIFLSIFTYTFRFDFLSILGGTSETVLYAEEYLNIILLGYVFQFLSFILTNAVRAEGKILLSMASMITSAVINIVLDYIFIGIMGFGVSGAAFATIIGQSVGFIILSTFYIRGKSILKLNKQNFVLDFNLLKNVTKIGFSSFIINAGGAISVTIMNNGLLKYGGNQAITAMGTTFSIQTLLYMPLIGLRQGMTPILGYNYGAKNKDRVYETLFLAMKVAFVFSIICFTLVETRPEFFVLFFLKEGSDTIPLAKDTLRIFLLMFPVYFINLYSLTLFQATQRGNLANIITILRQVIFIPVVIAMAYMFGLYGIIFATPVCDFLAVVVSGVLLIKEYRQDMIKN